MSHKKPRHKPDEAASAAHGSGNTGEHPRDQQNSKRFWKDYEPIEKFNFVIALFTIAYAVTTVGLFCLTRETLQVEQRAFVYVKDKKLIRIDPAHPPPLGTTGGISIDFDNSGATPARNVKHWVTACIKRGKLPNDFSFPEVPPSNEMTYLIPPRSESKRCCHADAPSASGR
jgi:hypothetical protein